MDLVTLPCNRSQARRSALVDVRDLIDAYYNARPSARVPAQRVCFGTSGHRGRSREQSFNEWHVLAITQAICDHRRIACIDGPLHVGIDTHALSRPALDSALRVLTANGVTACVAPNGEFTPTPAISRAILAHNRGRTRGLADGIVMTPSHNPPDYGGLKYNPADGGPADGVVTAWIQARANALLAANLKGVLRSTDGEVRSGSNVRIYDYMNAYVADLGRVIDFDEIRAAGIRMGVDPLGGAGVHYWSRIAERYHLDLTVIDDTVDPTFRFINPGRDGEIRTDPSSPLAMARIIEQKDRYDVAFACDADHDRHGIVTPGAGLLAPNHYLCVLIDYLFRHRLCWNRRAAVGKTVVSTALIDRVAKRLDRDLYEVPVGFKWFVDGLLDGSLGFAGEESAGASFLRRDGDVWTTDKDGIASALVAAEIAARTGRDPGEHYDALTRELGEPVAGRIDAPATPAQKRTLAALSPGHIRQTRLAGDGIDDILLRAPGNGAPIGGIKVVSANGWFAARPSGTEDLYKIYAESFAGEDHLRTILTQAQEIVDAALVGADA